MNDLSGIRYGPQIAAAAAAHGLDPKLLAAVAAQETGGPSSNSGNDIVGDGGHGHGIFQIDDRSWAFARSPAAMDPAKNANMAASILADNLERYGGNVHAALSAYNTGSPTATGTTTAWGDGRTLGYADSVLRHYADLGGTDPYGQLVAEKRETSGSVNALASLSATASGTLGSAASILGASGSTLPSTSDSTASSAATSASSSANPDLLGDLFQPQVTPLTPLTSWSQEMSANGPAGGTQASAADTAMANLVDPSDLNDSTGDAAD